MAQKDLTAQFNSLRDGFNSRRRRRNRSIRFKDIGLPEDDDLEGQFEMLNRTAGSSESGRGFAGKSTEESPYWVDSVGEVRKLTAEIKSRIKILNQQHKNRLLVRFDNSEVTKDKEIEMLTMEITDMFRQAEQKIKRGLFHHDGQEFRSTTSADFLVKQNIKKQLAQELQELSSSFRKTQKAYLQQLRSQKGEGGDINDILGLNAPSSMPQPTTTFLAGDQHMLLREVLDDETTEVVERDMEIQQIAKSIHELASIFQDLTTLVIDQGTMLDRIDYNMEHVQLKTEKGLEELIIADKYSENSRPFKCIMILIGVIVFEGLVLVMKN